MSNATSEIEWSEPDTSLSDEELLEVVRRDLTGVVTMKIKQQEDGAWRGVITGEDGEFLLAGVLFLSEDAEDLGVEEIKMNLFFPPEWALDE